MGMPHPSHPFKDAHPMVYKTARAAPKKLMMNEIWRMKNRCLQDEGVDSLSHRMRVFVWEFEGSHRVS